MIELRGVQFSGSSNNNKFVKFMEIYLKKQYSSANVDFKISSLNTPDGLQRCDGFLSVKQEEEIIKNPKISLKIDNCENISQEDFKIVVKDIFMDGEQAKEVSVYVKFTQKYQKLSYAVFSDYSYKSNIYYLQEQDFLSNEFFNNLNVFKPDSFTEINTDYSIKNSNIYKINCTSRDLVICLPDANRMSNQKITIVKTDETQYSAIIKPNGLQLINNFSEYKIRFQYHSVVLYSDGVNWIVL